MNSNELYIEAAQLKDDIQRALYHPYIFKHIEPPVIDDEKLLLLCSITKERDKDIRKETIVSTMLVQIALDIHDRILLIDLTSDNHKARQLTVLAGDYYSSLYYERLTAINARNLIRLLADGIKEINELKTQFLYGNNSVIDDLMSIQIKIDSNIINQFSIAATEKEIPEYLKELLLLKRLLHERALEANQLTSLWLHLFGRSLNHVDSSPAEITLLDKDSYVKTLQKIDAFISKMYRKVKTSVLKTDNEIIKRIFGNLENQLNNLKNNSDLFFGEEG